MRDDSGGSGRTWTDQRTETLKTLWGQGKSASVIAAKLGGGITRNAVVGKAHRLGLAQRESPIVRAKPPIELNGRRFCEYPIGDPKDPAFRFCGARRRRNADGTPDSSYCAEHHALCYAGKKFLSEEPGRGVTGFVPGKRRRRRDTPAWSRRLTADGRRKAR